MGRAGMPQFPRQEGQHFQNVSCMLIGTGPCLKANPLHTLAAGILHADTKGWVNILKISHLLVLTGHLHAEVANLKKPNLCCHFCLCPNSRHFLVSLVGTVIEHTNAIKDQQSLGN